MSTFTPSPIFEPQFLPVLSAALVFKPANGATVVPANVTYQITTCKVTNVSGALASMTIWRVPSGAAADNEHMRVPSTVLIPPATASAPWFDLTVLWGINLLGGDAIFAAAGVANALVIDADGLVIQ